MLDENKILTLHKALRERGWMCAVAESLTGGRIQSLLTGVSGASDVFAGGVTAYTIKQKVAHLNVDRDIAAACDGVSEAVVREMVVGVCSMFDCKCGVATTGYAEPNEDVKIAFAWVAVATGSDIVTKRIEANGTRLAVQQDIAERAVGFLSEALT